MYAHVIGNFYNLKSSEKQLLDNPSLVIIAFHRLKRWTLIKLYPITDIMMQNLK